MFAHPIASVNCLCPIIQEAAFSISGKGNLLRFGFSPAPAPRTLHPGTSFARWTSSTVLCPLAAVHFALRSRQTLCPFENNLFHRTYLCRSRLAEAEGRSFFAERCRHPGGGFCAVLRGFGAYFSSPWAYPQQTAFRVFRSPCLSLCQPALFPGKRSIPWLWRCAFCAVSVFDSGRSLWAVPMQPPGRPFPYGVCVHAPFAPEASAVLGFYADFGSVDSALRNAFPLPNSRWIWNRALQTFGSWGHPVGCRWTENPCVPVFLRGPSLPGASAPLSSVSAFARRNSALRVSEKAGLWKKSSRRVFCLVSRGPPPRLCRHCARGGDLSAVPVSFNCRVLPIFWMLRPARFPGLCPLRFLPHPGLAGRVPISGFPLDRSCSQPRSFARPAACGFFAVRRLLRIAA